MSFVQDTYKDEDENVGDDKVGSVGCDNSIGVDDIDEVSSVYFL